MLFRIERHTIVYTWRSVVGFEWDEANEGHIAEHDVTPEEAEETFFDPSRAPIGVYSTVTERRRGLLGRTNDGRLLFVVYTHRGGAIRVVTARDASARHRRHYERGARH